MGPGFDGKHHPQTRGVGQVCVVRSILFEKKHPDNKNPMQVYDYVIGGLRNPKLLGNLNLKATGVGYKILPLWQYNNMILFFVIRTILIHSFLQSILIGFSCAY